MALLALFDVDGTLLLTDDGLIAEATVASLREIYAVPVPDDALARIEHRGQTAKRIAREILRGTGLSDRLIDDRLDPWCGRLAERYVDLLDASATTHLTGRPGAEQALSSLERGGVRLALLTGNPEPVARARMERLGLVRFFPAGTGAFGCEHEDRAELIELARRRAGGWPAESTVEIGDTPIDVESAHQAGVRAVVIRSPRAPSEEFPEADAVVDDMESVARTLLAWSS